MKITLIIVLLCFLIVPLFAQDVNDIIEEVQEAYEDMDNLTAKFQQVETFKLTGSTTVLDGKIYVSGGQKYRFESDQQTIVTDGKTVWAYNTNTGQVIVDHARENSSVLMPRDLLFKYPKDYYATLLKEEEKNDNTIFVLKLEPKEDIHGYIKEMKIWVSEDTWYIQKIETTDLRNNSTVFEITDMDTKTELSDKLFTFEADDNIEVYDRRQD